MADDGLGAYGLSIGGLPGAAAWMQPVPAGRPHLQVEVVVAAGATPDHPSSVDGDTADLRLVGVGGGRLQARRGTGVATYTLAAVPPDEDLLHPYLAPAAALVWRWAGREALHAGVFTAGGGAVLVVGGKEAGKSTTLAWLAGTAGAAVLADDLAVLEGDQVQAGPRTLDLRSADGERTVRGGDRSRVTLGSVPPALPLAGIAVLDWGERFALTSVPMEDRPAVIGAHRMFPGLPVDPEALLELLAVPIVRMTRPPDPTRVAEAGATLLHAFE